MNWSTAWLCPLLLVLLWLPASAQEGLVGRWTFDEGQGAVSKDQSGQGNEARLHGASWVKRGAGYAVALDGQTNYVDCGRGPSLDLREKLTLEAWVKPTGSPAGETLIFGKHHEYYGITMYGSNGCWFYISSGGNNINSLMQLNVWNHLVGTFDGTTMNLYVNRLKVATRQSKLPTIAPGKNFLMGVLTEHPDVEDPGSLAFKHWRGELDEVRVYDRALSEAEVQEHYKAEAGGFDISTANFDRLQVTLYPFRAAQQVVAALDFSGIFPRPADARLEVAVVSPGSPAPVLRQEFASLPVTEKVSAFLDVAKLPPGEYTVRSTLSGSGGLQVASEERFSCPLPAPALPAPKTRRVGPLPAAVQPPPFTVQVAPQGGFTLTVKGRKLPLVSSLSFPNAGDNVLGVAAGAGNEPEWRVAVKKLKPDTYEVRAQGKSYTVLRQIRVLADRVSVKDTFTNTTSGDVGIMVDHRLDSTADPFGPSYVSGYPGGVRRKESESPSTYVSWPECGLGLVPLDDIFIVQAECYAEGPRAGLVTNTFGLGAGDSHTLEWAVYPTSRPDYYEFINRVRQDEGRNGTVEGGFAFIPQTPPISREHATLRNLKYASFGCLSNVADDPEIEIEGLEFMWLPQERARLKARFDANRVLNPDLRYMFHIAHSLATTNKPEQLFPDSRVMESDGKTQVVYPADYANNSYYSPQRRQEGYKWYIFYPMPGNSFHDLLLKSVDTLVDEIGCGGVFMDGFLYGYGSRYIYDKWDRRTVELDPATRTVKRRVGNVILLSQPSMVEFSKRLIARKTTVIANGIVMTRTIGQLPLVTDQECLSGPITHLAQTPTALGYSGNIKGESDIYKDVLDKLSWGLLYFYYGEGGVTYPSLPQQQYPITIESIHSGTVVGKQRIVTMKPGVYGWAGSRALPFCYRYNPLGARIAPGFLTTVDAGSVRTDVTLATMESAVLKQIPVTLDTKQAVNVSVEQYDGSGLTLALQGQGPVTLVVRDGDLAVKPGQRFTVSGAKQPVTADRQGVLRVPLTLQGGALVTVRATK